MSKRFAILLLALPGCIYDAGECWVRGEGDGEAGVGGSVIVGAGAGGFGDVPPEPQSTRDAPDPCVQTVHCEITWKGGSGSCQSAGPAPTCSAYYRGEHRSLDEAKKACELSIGVGKNPDAGSCGPCEWLTSANTKCEDKCYEAYDADHKKCDKMADGPGKAKCRQAAGENLSNCIKACHRKK